MKPWIFWIVLSTCIFLVSCVDKVNWPITNGPY